MDVRARVRVTTWREGRGPGADGGQVRNVRRRERQEKHGDMMGHEQCATGCVVKYGDGKPVHSSLEAAQESAG